MDPLTISLIMAGVGAAGNIGGGLLANKAKPKAELQGKPQDFIPGGKYNPGWEGVTPNMQGAITQLMMPPGGAGTIGGLEPGQISSALGPLMGPIGGLLQQKLGSGAPYYGYSTPGAPY